MVSSMLRPPHNKLIKLRQQLFKSHPFADASLPAGSAQGLTSSPHDINCGASAYPSPPLSPRFYPFSPSNSTGRRLSSSSSSFQAMELLPRHTNVLTTFFFVDSAIRQVWPSNSPPHRSNYFVPVRSDSLFLGPFPSRGTGRLEFSKLEPFPSRGASLGA